MNLNAPHLTTSLSDSSLSPPSTQLGVNVNVLSVSCDEAWSIKSPWHTAQSPPQSKGKIGRVVNPLITSNSQEKIKLSKRNVETTVTPQESTYIFDTEDNDTNIILEGNIVRAATIEKLVERGTTEKYTDHNYVMEFLMTYRQFTTPMALMELLITRYNMPEPKGATLEDLDAFRRYKLVPIRLRIFNLAKHWMLIQWLDFEDNPELQQRMRYLINLMTITGMQNIADQLEKLLSRTKDGEEGDKELMFTHQAPKSHPLLTKKGKIDKDLHILDIHPEEVARQLTIFEHNLFKKIKPWEFLNQRWSKADKLEKAPGIMAVTKRFNEVSKWVASLIVLAKDKKERVLVLNRLIEIAERCKRLNNFNAMTEIMSGLQSSSIYRLKSLWPELPSKQLDIFEEMMEIINTKSSYKNFREYLHRCQPPCVPYLGVYLTDLTFIEEGNHDSVNGNLVNFAKCRSISKVIIEIHTYQQANYCLAAEQALQDYLTNLKYLDEEECYRISLVIEGRSAGSSTTGLLPYVRHRASSGNTTQSSTNIDTKIRLPGAKISITLPIHKQSTAGDVLKNLSMQYGLDYLNADEELKLVIPPTDKSRGEILEFDQVLKDFKLDSQSILEVWGSPLVMKVAISLNNHTTTFQDAVVTYTMPLSRMIPVFQKMFNIISSEEYCFLYVEPEKDGYARFLRAHKSLKEERCLPKEGRIVVYPVSNFQNTAASQLKDATKTGYLIKQSRKRALSYTRLTPKKKRWFVLKDFFLFYYKNKTDPSPAGVIVLEYFTVKIEQEGNAKYLHLKRNFEEFANSVLAYNIYSEAILELLEWNKIISKRVLNTRAEVEGTLMYVVIFDGEAVPQRKYFVLEKNNSYIAVCNSKQHCECDEMIMLEDETTVSIPNESIQHKYGIRGRRDAALILHKQGKDILLVTENVGERDQWLQALILHGVMFVETPVQKVFREELDIVLKRENGLLPKFIVDITRYLKACGLSEPELFSKRGPEEEVLKFIAMVDEGRELPCSSASDICVLTTVLMDYLAQLPNPLLTTYRYERFLKAAQNIDAIHRVRDIKSVVDTLPAQNRNLLVILVRMWAGIYEADKLGLPPTMISPLVQVLAPILLRAKPTASRLIENEESLRCLVIADMIRHHEPVFGAVIGEHVKLKYGFYPTLPLAVAKKLIGITESPKTIPPPPSAIPPFLEARGTDEQNKMKTNRPKNDFKRAQNLVILKGKDSLQGSNQDTSIAAAQSHNEDYTTKIVVNFQQDQQFVVNLSKNNPATLTLDDFRRACDCPAGCLQDAKDPSRILIAGNIVVSPGVYQMIISYQSNMTKFNKRYSLPHTSPRFLQNVLPVQNSDEEEDSHTKFSWEGVASFCVDSQEGEYVE